MDFWSELEARQRAALWDRLAPALAGVTRVVGITHGRLQLSSLSIGAPTHLQLAQYPGLVFFALKRGVYGGAAPADRPQTAPAAVAVESHDGSGRARVADIPLAAVEGAAVAARWAAAGARLATYESPTAGKEGLRFLHLACHGDLRDGRPVVMLGEDRALDESVFLRGDRPVEVLANVCLGGRLAEDPLDGSPSGLVTGLLRRGARVVAAALPPVPDLWASVLGLLVTEEMTQGGLGLDRALARAKARLAARDWSETLAADLRAGFEAYLAPDVKQRAGLAAVEVARPALCISEVRDELTRDLHKAWWFVTPALAGLEAQLSALDLPARREAAAAATVAEVTAAAGDRLVARLAEGPPPDELGALVHGMIAFGESKSPAL